MNLEHYRDFVLLSLSKPAEIILGQRIFGEVNIDSIVIAPQLRAYNDTYIFLSLLATSGDIHLNPGPGRRVPKHPCTVCSKGVIATSKAVECDLCTKKTHILCTSNTTRNEYEKITDGQKIRYICNLCPDTQEIIENTPSPDASNNNEVEDTYTIPNDNHDLYQCFDRTGMHFIHLNNIISLLPKMSEIRIIA